MLSIWQRQRSDCDARRSSNACGIDAGSSSVDSDVDVNSVGALSAISITLSSALYLAFLGKIHPRRKRKLSFPEREGDTKREREREGERQSGVPLAGAFLQLFAIFLSHSHYSRIPCLIHSFIRVMFFLRMLRGSAAAQWVLSAEEFINIIY